MDAKRLRIVFMGTPEFAVASLRRLVEEGYNVVAVITAPDRPAGRGLKLQESAVKQYAVSQGLPVLQPERLKDPQFIETMRALNADLGIVIAFRMLPEVVWSMPRLGTFNLHASLLPQYRGAAPINWALINGEKETGVTTFLLNHQIDTGDMLGQRRVAITPEDNAGSLHDKLMERGVELVVETLQKIAEGTTTPIPQTTVSELKPAPKIFKENSRIDWQLPVTEIHNLIRGLSPYPAAWTEMKKKNGERLSVKIFQADVQTTTPPAEACGAVLSDGRHYLKIACRDGYLSVDELQVAGKRRMKVEEFLMGFKEVDSISFLS